MRSPLSKVHPSLQRKPFTLTHFGMGKNFVGLHIARI